MREIHSIDDARRGIGHRSVYPGDAIAQKKYDRVPRIRNQDRQHHAVQRAGLRLQRDRQDRSAYFKKINDEGGINAQDRILSYDDGYSHQRP